MFIDFRETGKEKERDRDIDIDVRNIDWLPPICIPAGEGSHNLGTCPDQELNLQPFDVRDDTPSN